MYMRGSNNQPEMVQEKLGILQAEIAELRTEVKHINRQSESRDRWVQGIGIAVLAAALMWFGQNAINSYSAQKVDRVGMSTNRAK
jgi:uncharacterized membrane protein YjjP (DUF1212 family)